MEKQTHRESAASRYVAAQETRCRSALDDAAMHLERSARLFAGPAPDYVEMLSETRRVIRQSYIALLEWHGLAPLDDAPLEELSRPAERLASALRTCRHRALPLEALAASLQNGPSLPVTVREGVLTGYYTARNTLLTVLGELPAPVRIPALSRVERAEEIRARKASPRMRMPAERPVTQRTSPAEARKQGRSEAPRTDKGKTTGI